MMRVEAVTGFGITVGMPRPGRRRFGFPAGGAFDSACFGDLQRLAGQGEEAVGLELSVSPAVFSFDEPSTAAFCGLEASIQTGSSHSRLANGVLHVVPAGSRLQVSVLRGWARGWLTVGGGLNGFDEGRRLMAGDEFGVKPVEMPNAAGGTIRFSQWKSPGVLRVIVSKPGILEDQAFTVDHRSNRVGIRLYGEAHPHDLEQNSEPACMGLIQLPPNGQPLILGPDGPTIGGYPRVGVVAQADFGLLAQLRPGDEVRFKPITREEAIALNQS